MNTKTTIPISQARKMIFDIAEKVQKPNNYYTLTDKGRPKAVIMSAEEFESWYETLEVISDFPDLQRDIKETNRAIKSGEYKKWATLDEILAKESFLIADKPTKKYGLSRKIKTKDRERTQ